MLKIFNGRGVAIGWEDWIARSVEPVQRMVVEPATDVWTVALARSCGARNVSSEVIIETLYTVSR